MKRTATKTIRVNKGDMDNILRYLSAWMLEDLCMGGDGSPVPRRVTAADVVNWSAKEKFSADKFDEFIIDLPGKVPISAGWNGCSTAKALAASGWRHLPLS